MGIKDHSQDLEAELAAKRPALFAYVRGIVRNVETAEDITQEAMLRAYRSISGLKDHNRLGPWLYRIATNICHDHFRKNKRTRELAKKPKALIPLMTCATRMPLN